MNARVLELIKHPELFQINDLQLLNQEIEKHPYIQSFRALHLYGTHLFNPENYQSELATTAAYTTDKKILYQLINKKTVETKSDFVEERKPTETVKSIYHEVEVKLVEGPKPVIVNGEVNRILFEGEEDFLERPSEIIDLESTLESGVIVTQSVENKELTSENQFIETDDAESFSKDIVINEDKIKEEKPEIENNSDISFQETQEFLPDVKVPNETGSESTTFEEAKDAEDFSKETVIKEEVISTEEPIIENPAQVSFHASESFLPDVKLETSSSKSESYSVPKPTVNRHEEEMQRLIAEVEAKMKLGKKSKIKEEEANQNTEVNFAETQNFEVINDDEIKTSIKEIEERPAIEKPEILIKSEKKESKAYEKEQKSTEFVEKSSEPKSEWKPMQFAGNTPDSLIAKNVEEKTSTPKVEVSEKKEKPKEIIEVAIPQEKIETKTEERPVFNVSFFTQKVSPIESEKNEEQIEIESKVHETPKETAESNIPTFINTWQNWLKIDRNQPKTEEKTEISITEIKNKVIDNFIENEPKISKLKENSDFVIKEKSDDISHLMTETLAKLYTEQKLYSKAIKAYEILSNKFPDKKSEFADKIKEIKELRQNK